MKKVSSVQKARAVSGMAIIIFSASAGFLGGWIGAGSHSRHAVSDTVAQRQVVTSESKLISGIANDVGPSVVSVNVTSQTDASQSPYGYYIRGGTQQSAGTGFIVSSDGIIVTNRHVVPAGTTSVSVVLSDGTELDNVQVLGRTNDTDSLDVAFLKVTDKKGKTLKPVTLGDSSKMQIGDMVVAIGNALGQFQNTVTSGIISGHGREVQAGDESGGDTENLTDLFQTDAAINQGNSGGPLVNADGQVIGINTAVAGDAQNIGFAIPINDVSTLIQGVLKTGKVERPYLGVRYVMLSEAYAKANGISATKGAYIDSGDDGAGIVAGSPADKAGLREKDVITKVGDITLDDTTNLTTAIGRHSVGDTVTLTVVRDGKTITVKANLAATPSS